MFRGRDGVENGFDAEAARAVDLDVRKRWGGDKPVDAVHSVFEAALAFHELARAAGGEGGKATEEVLVHGLVDAQSENTNALQTGKSSFEKSWKKTRAT
jgi:hypothetical protein